MADSARSSSQSSGALLHSLAGRTSVLQTDFASQLLPQGDSCVVCAASWWTYIAYSPVTSRRECLQVASEPCYNVLRTREQLGYSVHCGLRLTHAALGFVVVVVSGKAAPAQLHTLHHHSTSRCSISDGSQPCAPQCMVNSARPVCTELLAGQPDCVAL